MGVFALLATLADGAVAAYAIQAHLSSTNTIQYAVLADDSMLETRRMNLLSKHTRHSKSTEKLRTGTAGESAEKDDSRAESTRSERWCMNESEVARGNMPVTESVSSGCAREDGRREARGSGSRTRASRLC